MLRYTNTAYLVTNQKDCTFGWIMWFPSAAEEDKV